MCAIVSTAFKGYEPEADSPLNIVADAPCKTALATSEVSARVGTGFVIMDSNICVATITGLPAAVHFSTINFCKCGTLAPSISTPKSPRATIIASVAAMISSKLSIAKGVSILAITFVLFFP